MLKGNNDDLDLKSIAAELMPEIEEKLESVYKNHGEDAIEVLDEDVIKIQYPILEFPTKIKSFNLDKVPLLQGKLEGIKGQYLIFDSGVINIRKYSSYEVSLQTE